jgi:cobalt-zinc-cadmium efflux system membrane fusion protein
MVLNRVAQIQKLTIVLGSAALICIAGFAAGKLRTGLAPARAQEAAKPVTSGPPRFTPSATEWASLTIETVTERVFRAEHVTEGKIAVNEDTSTPIFSPYAGRVSRLLAKPSDVVQRGQPLLVIEATDTIQALNDFVTASGSVNTARSKLDLAQIVEKRANDLYAGKAVPLKDWQQAQADLIAAQNDMRSAETGLEAAHNRLRILGRSDDEIAVFQQTRRMSADTPIVAPIAGTVVQRKVGPGQFINSGATDPVFVIGDLSTVWLVAFVRETEASDIAVGQDVRFRVLAVPDRDFTAQLVYVSAAIDPATRRLLVRATIDNKDGLFKPEMFASVTIFSGGDHPAPAVPKRAIIYEGDRVHVWVARDDKTIELRQITTGLINGDLVEARGNLKAGEKIVTKGSLFIDRAASAI